VFCGFTKPATGRSDTDSQHPGLALEGVFRTLLSRINANIAGTSHTQIEQFGVR
jgi:hypothetical protein